MRGKARSGSKKLPLQKKIKKAFGKCVAIPTLPCRGTMTGMVDGNVEKSRQRRSRPFAVLTYYEYAPRVKRAAALLDGLF